MQVTHSKVSGETNPGTGEIGGEDWDAAHVVSGLRIAGYLSCTDTNGTFTVDSALGVPSYCIVRDGTGVYKIYIDDAALPKNNVQFIASVEVNDNASTQAMEYKTLLEPNGGPLGGGTFTLRVYRDASGTGVFSSTTYCKFKILILRTD